MGLKVKKQKNIFMAAALLLLLASCDSKIADPSQLQATVPYYGGTPPDTILSTLNGGEHIQGGSIKNIHFKVTDVLGFNSNKMEYSRDGGTTWVKAESARQIDTVHYPSLTAQDTVFDWLVPIEPDCAASSLASDSAMYKFRITSSGRPDALPRVVTSAATFTVDSCAPALVAAKLTNLATYNHGFAKLQLESVADAFTLSPVSHVCVKLNSAVPLVTDSCWASVIGLNVTPSAASTTFVIPYFLGFQAGTYTLSVWVKDAADNISAYAGTEALDALSIAYSCGGSNCSSMTSTLAAYNSTAGHPTAITKTGVPAAAANTTVLDPGLFVVTSDGAVYARDRVAGILKLDPLANSSSTFIAMAGSAVDGGLAVAKVKQPLRLGLDSNENLIIYDYDRIRRVNLHAATPNIETLIGGGSTPDAVSDTLTDATNLGFTYHDNILWYGTFAVLPNDYIIFNSENPNVQLNNGGTRFRLRVYQPDQTNKIDSVKFSGTGVFGNSGLSVDALYPYGPMGIAFDKTTMAVTKAYARLCEGATTCANHNSALFDYTGAAIAGATSIPTYWSNGSFIVSRSGDVWAANAYEGGVYKFDTNTNSWSWMLGSGSGAGCIDGTFATSFTCTIDLWDAYIGQNEVLYFVDAGKVRFVDTDGKVRTLAQ